MFGIKQCEHKVCKTCKHLYEDGAGKTITVQKRWDPVTDDREVTYENYCNEHAPGYDIKRESMFYGRGDLYFVKNFQVDEQGEPIGYKKVEKKLK